MMNSPRIEKEQHNIRSRARFSGIRVNHFKLSFFIYSVTTENIKNAHILLSIFLHKHDNDDTTTTITRLLLMMSGKRIA
jgi:hypothetical protein